MVTMVTMLTMLVLALACASVGASEPQYPAPAPSPEASQFGAGIQRTMTLLATSTPEHRNRVRILFYGQSITEQSWSVAVADYLRSHFPYADLEIENCAIGGFLAEFLEKDAETDLYPRYPDLMIFDDYGDTAALARIIANTRRRTTSEILLQNYHLRRPEDAEADRGEDAASYGFLPALAAEYGCELVDQRTPWRQYLKDNGLAPQALLDNTVHLNAEGNYLMAKLVEEHLRCRPELPNDTWHDLVRTHPLNGDLGWHDRRLALEFDGNRVDLIAAPGAGEEERARVLIDGAPPSANPALYAFTRASLAPGVWWPAVIGVTSSAPLLVEDWTLRVFDASDDMKHFRFAVTGSKTGPDGEGTSEARFVSRSGRIVVEPSAWERLVFAREYSKQPVPPDFEIRWSVVPLFQDEYLAPEFVTTASETATTVAQGLSNGHHRLELVVEEGGRGGTGQTPAIRAIRVYRPPVK